MVYADSLAINQLTKLVEDWLQVRLNALTKWEKEPALQGGH